MTTLRDRLAKLLASKRWGTMSSTADAILAIPELQEALRDAERFRFEHSASSVKWMIEIERRAISIPGTPPIEWWREQIDAAIAAKGKE